MNETLTLLRHFIRNPKQVGAIIPSSAALSREMLAKVDFRNAKTILELGPGLGIFTRGILKRARKDARIVCFEINWKFCKFLSARFKDKRIQMINSGAEKLGQELIKLGIKKADCVISGLPFRNFTKWQQEKILCQVSESLTENGKFVLFQYTNGLRSMLEEHFSSVDRTFVAMNVPPAFVYVCKK